MLLFISPKIMKDFLESALKITEQCFSAETGLEEDVIDTIDILSRRQY